ncbi:DUF3443 domain-containing protein [Paraburkholderia sp. NMBU_R16]|uniref:DUF3443 domain-containing protein n=1 Tax=Paraburkholderia sp. NMBU_R16 TaxID=2698676 RepID=UPI001C259580|nr:DUF3443 domain-containing protein [Paraburkholderia sp. NMBU_R16]
MQPNSRLVRALSAFAAALIALIVAGCGGGGSNSSSSSGGTTAASNQVAVSVETGTAGLVNIPTVSVTVCKPGTSTCQTINNIQLDTMSYGLRIVNTAAAAVLSSLSIETDSSGNQIAECTVFADGYTWGSVRSADVTIGSKTAGNIPIGIIGDMAASTVPSGCSSAGNAENTVAAVGANGILGIGVKPYDCGSTCVTSVPTSPFVAPYYSCPGGTNCTGTMIALSQQVTTPVVKFSSDNNGVILTMPTISSGGANSVTGMLTFGIGTQSNNGLSGVTVFGTDSAGDVNGTFNGTTGLTFFDSGSNAFFFADATLAECSNGFYCPQSPTTRSVSISNASGASASVAVTMPIQNAATLFNSGNFAFNDLAADSGTTLSNAGFVADVGMPFFYGRTVFFGYDQSLTGGTQTPYVAF